MLSILIFACNIQVLFADMMEKGRTKVKAVFNIYHQNSEDGAQVFDNSGREEANVIEPMVFIEHQITEDTAIEGHFVFDAWTAASDTKLDGNTGASGKGIGSQGRVSGNIGVRREVDKWEFGTSFGFSSEYDYKSINASFNVSRSFAKDNFTLGYGLQIYKDELSLFDDLSNPSAAKISEGHDRKIISNSINASQILTRKDIIQFGASYTHAEGAMESTASSVIVNGQRRLESLPENRDRYAVFGQWVHGMGEDKAINTTYRHYWDHWGLNADTIKVSFLKEYNDDEDFFELFARYHNQSSVDYFKRSFSQTEVFMTSDSDIEDFSSYEVGVFHTYTLGEMGDLKIFNIDFEDVSWSNSIVYSKRSNGMRYGYYQTAIGFSF